MATKKELIEQGKELGLSLIITMPKAVMESEIEKAKETKKINKSDPPTPPLSEDDLYNWAFGYSKANTPKSRMVSRWRGLHRTPYPGLKKVKQLYQEFKCTR